MATLTKVSQLLVQNMTRISQKKINQTFTTTNVINTENKLDIESDDSFIKYDVPKYKKINSWDMDNQKLKVLGRILSSKRDRTNSDSVVLEGTRMICEAMKHGLSPSVIVFSREKLLWQLGLDKNTASTCKLYHLPYKNIKMWTDLSTSPGVMAAFSKQDIEKNSIAKSPVPLTLICDNIRTPDNLGAVIRVAAAAGAKHVLCTRGCCDAWAPKVIRAGAGAHFLLPIIQSVEWSQVDNHVDPYAKVLLSDLVYDFDQDSESLEKHEGLEKIIQEIGLDRCYTDKEICDYTKTIPMQTIEYCDLDVRGHKEAVVVVGGETEGVSGAAYLFAQSHGGSRMFIPLRNNVNSLNVISAASLVLFKVRESLLKESANT